MDTGPAAMTEVSIVPEVWARLAHACDGSMATAATTMIVMFASLLVAKVRRKRTMMEPRICYNAKL